MLDPTSASALISGGFGLSTILIVRWWNRRDAAAAVASERAATDATVAAASAAEAAKIAAAGAAALGRENARAAAETHRILRDVEHNVNGRLGRQIELAETSQADAQAMRAEISALKTLFAEVLAARPGALAEAREAISRPTDPAPVVPPLIAIPAKD